MAADRKTVDEWDKEDIIVELKAGIPRPGTKLPGVCDFHPSLAKGMIYLLRRLPTEGKDVQTTTASQPVSASGWKACLILLAKLSPLSLFGLSAVGLVYALLFYMGALK